MSKEIYKLKALYEELNQIKINVKRISSIIKKGNSSVYTTQIDYLIDDVKYMIGQEIVNDSI